MATPVSVVHIRAIERIVRIGVVPFKAWDENVKERSNQNASMTLRTVP
ncbi:MAG: hypothetical protein WCE44_09190 [Candidatus Velthaea sp.]|jgi:hypothetical protein